MGTAAARSRKAVKRSKPKLRLAPPPPPEPVKVERIDPLEYLRERIEDSAGILPMGCGCFIKVNQLKLSIGAILSEACAAAGTCPHQQAH